MALPTGTITMNDVNIELSRASGSSITLNDTDVRNLAGVPSGTISMDNLRGKSAIPSVYTIYNAGTESAVMTGFVPGTHSSGGTTNGTSRTNFRNQAGNGVWGAAPLNTIEYRASDIFLRGSPFQAMGYTRLGVGLDLADWEFGTAANFRSQYSNIRITYTNRRGASFYTEGQDHISRGITRWDSSSNTPTAMQATFLFTSNQIRQLEDRSTFSVTRVDTYLLRLDSSRYHYIGIQGWVFVNFRQRAEMVITKIEAL